MPITYIAALLGTGVGVGFCSGLLGVGGCFIMIPVQYWIYTGLGVSTDIAIRLAFGTNLAVVLPTAASGAWGHHQRGAVWWKAALVLGGCGLVSSIGGATAAAHISGSILKIVFGAAIMAGAIRMLTAKPAKIEEEPKDNPKLWAAWGLCLGAITGLIGIGGGVLAVPIMVLFLKFKMHQAVGSSTAMMILTSIGGLIGYIVNGLGVAGIPSPHLGYFHLWSWLCLAGTSVGMAQVGAKTAHMLPAKQLRLIFIIVMLYMGLKMVGVFEWLHLPI